MARAGLGLALLRRMHTRRPLAFLIAIVFLAFVATPLTAADPAVTITHVRPMSPELQSLVDEGVERSPALRALVAKLEASNVIVYVNFREFPEKIIALFAVLALDDKPLPMYSSTRNRREWLHVIDLDGSRTGKLAMQVTPRRTF